MECVNCHSSLLRASTIASPSVGCVGCGSAPEHVFRASRITTIPSVMRRAYAYSGEPLPLSLVKYGCPNEECYYYQNGWYDENGVGPFEVSHSIRDTKERSKIIDSDDEFDFWRAHKTIVEPLMRSSFCAIGWQRCPYQRNCTAPLYLRTVNRLDSSISLEDIISRGSVSGYCTQTWKTRYHECKWFLAYVVARYFGSTREFPQHSRPFDTTIHG